MKKFAFIFALIPLSLLAQKSTIDTKIPNDKKLQELFQCPGLTRDQVTAYYENGDTFSVRKTNGSWGRNIKGKVIWEHYIIGTITALVDCNTSTSPIEIIFPDNYMLIFINCDSTIMILEEFNAVYLAETKTGTTYMVEICDADLSTLLSFDIEIIRNSTVEEIEEYKTLVEGEIISPYTIISKHGQKGKKEKIIFAWAKELKSLKN